jgi:transcriptional regulator with XRE-family HTH domain
MLRQLDLAQKAGVSRATIDALENGRAAEIGFSRVARILAAVGLGLEVCSLSAQRQEHAAEKRLERKSQAHR